MDGRGLRGREMEGKTWETGKPRGGIWGEKQTGEEDGGERNGKEDREEKEEKEGKDMLGGKRMERRKMDVRNWRE